MAYTDMVDRFEEFLREAYEDEIGRAESEGEEAVLVDFSDLEKFDHEFADRIVEKPGDALEAAEEAVGLLSVVDKDLNIRFQNLPDRTEVKIRDLRSEHIGNMVAVHGLVKRASEVRPEVTSADFECTSCGDVYTREQDSAKLKSPYKCDCGNRKFEVVDKEMVDVQGINVEENPRNIEGSEQPRDISVYLREDLVDPEFQKNVTPGNQVVVNGILREAPQDNDSKRYDIYLEGNYVDPKETEFRDIKISEEEEEEIKELAENEDVFQSIVNSIAPSIYGHEKIKEAIALQLFSGVRKERPDGTVTRGDMHILLIGEPGTGKCLKGDTKVRLADGSERKIRDIVEENLDSPKEIDDGVYDTVDIAVPSLGAEGDVQEKKATKVWKREAPDTMYRVRTSGGSELEVTPSHPLFIQSSRSIRAVKTEELKAGMFIATASNPSIKQSERFTGRNESQRQRNTPPQESRQTAQHISGFRQQAQSDVAWERIETLEPVQPDYDWVYDLEVEDTHNYISNNIFSHNSQLLQYVGGLAPKGKYVVGKSATGAGITATVVRDEITDAWSLEAGALVLANKGIVTIDEIDKMSNEDRSSLHEAAEQQTISISKANIQATLQARTAILAAGNPKFGRFDPYEPIPEQINIGDTLLSRFDLIFPVKDRPDEEKDRKLADHVMDMHTEPDEYTGEIETDLLRKYIAYGKQHIYPEVTDKAKDRLKDFYVRIRGQGSDREGERSVPMTARQLEALIRLSEASARVRLSDTVEEEDAQRAIDLLTHSLKQIGTDPETGEFDIDRVETGMASSERGRVQQVKRIITNLQGDSDSPVPVEDVLAEAEEQGIGEERAEEALKRLEEEAEIYRPQQGGVSTL